MVLPSHTVFLQNHSLGRKNVGIHLENYLLEINREISGSAELVRKQTTKERAYQSQNKMFTDALIFNLLLYSNLFIQASGQKVVTLKTKEI